MNIQLFCNYLHFRDILAYIDANNHNRNPYKIYHSTHGDCKNDFSWLKIKTNVYTYDECNGCNALRAAMTVKIEHVEYELLKYLIG